MTTPQPRDSNGGPHRSPGPMGSAPQRGADAAAGGGSGGGPSELRRPPADLASLGRELRNLEDTVARGLPSLEQQLVRLETDLPRLIREQNRGLPEWTDDRIDRRLAPIERLVQRTRNSAARVHQRASELGDDLERLRKRAARVAKELERGDPRLDRLEDRLARTARVVEESRRLMARRSDALEQATARVADHFTELEETTHRAGERLEARLDALEPRFRTELDRRFEQLPRIEARLREDLQAAAQEIRGRELERAEAQQAALGQWQLEERRSRIEHEQSMRDNLELLDRQLEGLRRHRDLDNTELEQRLGRFTRGLEEPLRQLERRFDAAILEDRQQATRWRWALVIFAVAMVVWQLLG